MLKLRPKFVLVVVLSIAAVSSCANEGDDARSGEGPTPRENTVEEGASARETGAGGEAVGEEGTTTSSSTTSTTTTTTVLDVTATTPEELTIVGSAVVPEGEAGSLSVVQTGELEVRSGFGALPVVVRNMTQDNLYGVEASATARGSDGTLSGSGASLGFTPSVVEPGEWAFGFIFFDSELPSDATYEVTATGETDPAFFGSVDVKPVEVNIVPGEFSAQQVVGIVENPGGEQVEGPVSVSVACFDEPGTTILSTHQGFTDANSIAPGGTASFSVDLFDASCPNFAVGASGFNF